MTVPANSIGLRGETQGLNVLTFIGRMLSEAGQLLSPAVTRLLARRAWTNLPTAASDVPATVGYLTGTGSDRVNKSGRRRWT